MISLINPISYIIAALFVLAIEFGFVLVRYRHSAVAWIILFLSALILAAGELVFRVGPSEIESVTEFDRVLARDKPVVLEIYSNY